MCDRQARVYARTHDDARRTHTCMRARTHDTRVLHARRNVARARPRMARAHVARGRTHGTRGVNRAFINIVEYIFAKMRVRKLTKRGS